MDYYTKLNQKDARRTGIYDKIMGSLTKCPFCDLKEKYLINDTGLCVLTVNLFPYTDGHMLIIPKRHLENFEDLTDEEWDSIKTLINRAKQKLKEKLKIDSFNILYNDGPKSGASLGHFHIQIIPADKEVLKKLYQQINMAPIELAKKLKD